MALFYDKTEGGAMPNLGLAPPPNILVTGLQQLSYISIQVQKERSVAFKIHKMRFRPRHCPRPRWGAHDAPPDPLVGWKPIHIPHFNRSFGASISRLRCLPHSAPSVPRFEGALPQIFSFRTPPKINAENRPQVKMKSRQCR